MTVVFAESARPSDRGMRDQVTVDKSGYPKGLLTGQGLRARQRYKPFGDRRLTVPQDHAVIVDLDLGGLVAG